MALLDTIREIVAPADPTQIPPGVELRMRRGREEMLRDAPKRRLCQRFEKGDHYWYLDFQGKLQSQDTVTRPNGTGKPPHRVRNSYNFIRPMVSAKVSNATLKVPGYEVIPSTTDPEDASAARIAEKVATYGYDQWNLRKVRVKGVRLAIGGGGAAYALPYFDSNVGPYTEVLNEETGEVENVGQGEIKVFVFDGNQVYWEAGADFDESPFWAVERAQPVDHVQDRPGFFNGLKLVPDATTSDLPTERRGDNLVIVTEFFERPCPKYPDGRYIVMANGQVICPIEPYPLRDPDGSVVDEPVLHRLQYTLGLDKDDDLGLTWQLIDSQRTIEDCLNKLVEWKNRCLNPKMKAPVGSIVTPPDDTPGAVVYYNPVMGEKPEWETPPQIPQSLFQIFDVTRDVMREIAGDEQIDAAPDVAARTVQQVIEQSQARWAYFLAALAEWDSQIMRHCLTLVQLHYTEPRLLKIKGRMGPERLPDFQGADLMGQVDVRVNPRSLEVQSQKQVVDRTLAFADRGWLSPQAAMGIINGGTAEKLGESYELDVAKANQVIAKIRDGSVMQIPNRLETNPVTGQLEEIPGWMPRDGIDNTEIWKAVLSDWMKTEDWDRLPPQQQEVGNLIFKGLLQIEALEQARMMAAQTAQAEQQGMNNAAKEQQAKPSPDQRSLDEQN